MSSGLKYITVPKNIKLVNLLDGSLVKTKNEKGEDVDFPEFEFRMFLSKVLDHNKFKQSFEYYLSACAIATAFHSKVAEGVFVLSNYDWKNLEVLLKEVFLETFGNLNTMFLVQLKPFLDAILNASDSQPVP